MSERVLLTVDDGVATLTLNHPEHRNAIDDAMREELPPAIARLGERDVRVAIVTGAGEAFSAGGSLDHFEREWHPRDFRRSSKALSHLYDELEALEIPVIAAINGPATGAGLQLALACDLRFIGASARIGYREHHIGLIPSHGGATRLVKLIGLSRAKQMYFRGDLVSAEEAERFGLIHEIVADADLLSRAQEEARRLAKRAPTSLGLAKKLLNAAANVDVRSGLELESLAQSLAIQTVDHREGVKAFREKRKPDFRGE